jgi:hypothetical protein
MITGKLYWYRESGNYLYRAKMGLLDLLFRKKAKENQIDSNKTDVTSGKIAPTVPCPKNEIGSCRGRKNQT